MDWIDSQQQQQHQQQANGWINIYNYSNHNNGADALAFNKHNGSILVARSTCDCCNNHWPMTAWI
jgi:hypothetical protein